MSELLSFIDLILISSFFRKIENCELELLNSEFLQSAIKSVNNVLHQTKIEEIICLGIGRISECSIAKHQLAFISIIAKHLKTPAIKFFDPIFTSSDKKLIELLNHQVLTDNKEGKYVADVPTLFYLPHCPKQITNNLLFSNWNPEHVKNLFLICNSFKSIIEATPERFLRPNASFLLEINPFVTEVEIDNNFKFSDIFNDFALHSFPAEKLQKIPKSFWNHRPEPIYTDEDLELIPNDGR